MSISEPIKTKPLLIIEPEWEQSISINTDLNYFYVPSLPEWTRYEYDGLLYEGVQYNWDEVDYRLSVEIPTIPECSFSSIFIGLVLAGCVILRKITNK